MNNIFGKVAVLLMNNANASAELSFAWAQLPAGGWRPSGACVRVYASAPPPLFTPCLFTPSSYGRYDVWQRRSLGTLAGAGFTSAAFAPRDSAFITLADC